MTVKNVPSPETPPARYVSREDRVLPRASQVQEAGVAVARCGGPEQGQRESSVRLNCPPARREELRHFQLSEVFWATTAKYFDMGN